QKAERLMPRARSPMRRDAFSRERMPMTEDEILAELRAAEALLEGHLILSSGLRSPRYLQCARVLMDPQRAARLAEALAATIPAALRADIDIVVSPAMGGVIIGHEMGRAIGVE